jgi:hypothetical protein
MPRLEHRKKRYYADNEHTAQCILRLSVKRLRGWTNGAFRLRGVCRRMGGSVLGMEMHGKRHEDNGCESERHAAEPKQWETPRVLGWFGQLHVNDWIMAPI